jgi:3-oxoacid CoA-transferase B subunit
MIQPMTREQVARRVALDVPNGSYVNLGIGIPTLVADYLPPDREVVFQSENGVLGVGPAPAKGEEIPDLINASKHNITLVPGGSYFVHTDAFLMIRGGHIDLALLGALEVAANGDIANWSTGPGEKAPAVGGAMDLAVGARNVWVAMEHTTKKGEPKIVETCRYPLTASGVVKRIYTNLAVIEVTGDGLLVREMAPEIEFQELQNVTAAPLRLANDWKRVQ